MTDGFRNYVITLSKCQFVFTFLIVSSAINSVKLLGHLKFNPTEAVFLKVIAREMVINIIIIVLDPEKSNYWVEDLDLMTELSDPCDHLAIIAYAIITLHFIGYEM